jgi:hypothetical protein
MSQTTVTPHPPRSPRQERIHSVRANSAALFNMLTAQAVRYERQRFSWQRFGSLEAVVLAHGRRFTKVRVPVGHELGPMGRCYNNAFHAVVESLGTADQLTYCEGFALPSSVSIAVEHAWAVDGAGRVIDPTWDDAPRCGYVGVPLTLAHLMNRDELDFRDPLGVTLADVKRDGLPASALA